MSGRCKWSHFCRDIEFDKKEGNSKNLMYNEVYYPLFEKRKILDPAEKYLFRLSERTMRRNNKNNILSFEATKKSTCNNVLGNFHSSLFQTYSIFRLGNRVVCYKNILSLHI